MLARYDLKAARSWRKESLTERAPRRARYRELMPLLAGDEPITLGEGSRPPACQADWRLARSRSTVAIKDESLNPTNSVKAPRPRSRRCASRAETVSPADGGQRRQWRRGLRGGRRNEAKSSSRRTPSSHSSMSAALRRNVTLVEGLIPDAGKIATETAKPRGWVRSLDVSRGRPRRRKEEDGL
jgi:hypothetical protein